LTALTAHAITRRQSLASSGPAAPGGTSAPDRAQGEPKPYLVARSFVSGARRPDRTARLLALIREFDARGGWNTGFLSCAAWLAWRVGLDLGAERERVGVAHALETLPLLASALARGELYAKVRALTRVATPETEARLLAVGRAGTAAHVERIVRGWRQVDRRAEARQAARQHEGRGLQLYADADGMVVVRLKAQ
jgi:hypothetical protein